MGKSKKELKCIQFSLQIAMHFDRLNQTENINSNTNINANEIMKNVKFSSINNEVSFSNKLNLSN